MDPRKIDKILEKARKDLRLGELHTVEIARHMLAFSLKLYETQRDMTFDAAMADAENRFTQTFQAMWTRELRRRSEKEQ